jgi:hypothetical protein
MEQAGNTGFDLLYIILLLLGFVLGLAVLVLIWVIWRVGRIDLPDDAGFFATLRLTPLSVVILLDLLDFGLDFLSAPVAWVLLNWLGLKPLRAVAVIEGLIPGTHLLPTMTIAWIVARLIGEGKH